MDIMRAKNESKIFETPIYANLSLTINLENYEILKLDQTIGSLETFFKKFLEEKIESTGVKFKNGKDNLYFYEFKSKTGDKEEIQVELIEDNEEKLIVNIVISKQGEVFFGEFPLMTDRGTFVINGSEKVVVSQLVRSPGSYFKKELNRKNGETIYYADIIPSRDNKSTNIFYVKIDKSRKTTATSLLSSFGMSKDEILNLFENNTLISSSYETDNLIGDPEIDFQNQVQEIYKKIRQGETATAEGASKYIYSLLFDKRKYDLTKAGRFKLKQKLSVKNRILGTVLAEDLIDKKGNVVFPKNTEVTKEIFKEVVAVLDSGAMTQKVNFSKEIESGIVPLIGITEDRNDEFLNVPDILATISYLVSLMSKIGEVDDIDHLGNRRVRTVGELLQNQFRIGMIRIEKNVKEKISTTTPFKMRPANIINNKPLTAIIGEFFNLSQLSQFMDQTNPLAELTNKRRLTALGPGGLSRDRAALEVRDVHPSHYGRICPIETPEGPNIGLINNLSTYARINEFGFIETPYRKVENGVVLSDEYEYLTADKERDYIVAQANINISKEGKILDQEVIARYRGDDIMAAAKDIDYLDVSPKQIVSIATSCIPFLENDDANRALMGANMQRQAVPVINPESPIVGTGVEYEAARDSGEAIVATEDGTVSYVDSKRIVVKGSNGPKTYILGDFNRSNSGTVITHLPIVKVGQKIAQRDILADGPSMEKERIVQEDKFTSMHIDEYTLERRQTKQGHEEITREIPNVSEQTKKYLDEDGIIAIGSEVKSGDILIGKITPKSQTQLSPEDKLLQAIFGEKSRNVKDNSLRVPNGGDGIVQSIKRYKREDGYDLPADILEIVKVFVVQKRKIQEGDKMAGRHGNKGVISKILPVEDMPHTEDGTPVDIMLNPQGIPSRMNIGQVLEIHLGMAAKKLGLKVSTPVFEGVNEEELIDIMNEAGMTSYGKVKLIDGRTGEAFDKPISVGVMYMLKLSHMVDDKLHARNIGPYSLITQQPLGGKAQNDDIKGRIKTYEAIVRSKKDKIIPIPTPGIPESFNVLTKEIQGLGFDMHMVDAEGNKTAITAYDEEFIGEENETDLRDSKHIKKGEVLDLGNGKDLEKTKEKLASSLEEVLEKTEDGSFQFKKGSKLLEQLRTPGLPFSMDEITAFISRHTDIKFGIGASALETLLKEINLKEEVDSMRETLKTTKSVTEQERIFKRLEVLNSLHKSNSRPE
ncbi:hypothetical protein FQR65_LT17019 [Abscondita terminalis]|nr:hypothetical protein FQR65_LT17019 [Abscondita terminalis]